MWAASYWAKTYWPGVYWPPSGEIVVVTPTPGVGLPKPRRIEYTKWPKLGRRPSLKELQQFYEATQVAPSREAEATPIEVVADDVQEVVQPYKLERLDLPPAVDWWMLVQDNKAYERLIALYEEFIARELDYQEDLLLAAMVAW